MNLVQIYKFLVVKNYSINFKKFLVRFFCGSRRADSKYIYFLWFYKVFYTIIGRLWKKIEERMKQVYVIITLKQTYPHYS